MLGTRTRQTLARAVAQIARPSRQMSNSALTDTPKPSQHTSSIAQACARYEQRQRLDDILAQLQRQAQGQHEADHATIVALRKGLKEQSEDADVESRKLDDMHQIVMRAATVLKRRDGDEVEVPTSNRERVHAQNTMIKNYIAGREYERCLDEALQRATYKEVEPLIRFYREQLSNANEELGKVIAELMRRSRTVERGWVRQKSRVVNSEN